METLVLSLCEKSVATSKMNVDNERTANNTEALGSANFFLS